MAPVLRWVGSVAAVLVVFGIWAGWGFLSFILPQKLLDTPTDRLGVWGDSFGGLTSLFTALGFIAIVAGFRLQRAQVRLGQEEQHRQRFDSWYFELLKLLREARDAVKFRHSAAYQKARSTQSILSGQHQGVSSIKDALSRSRPTTSGIDAFKTAWFEAKYFLDKVQGPLTKDQVVRVYDAYIHSKQESVFGPYFRILYTILERIDSDNILSEDEKLRYGRLLRGQLTSYETALAGLNGMSRVSKDFDSLLIRFRLLKYLPRGNRRRLLSAYYPPKAFSARD